MDIQLDRADIERFHGSAQRSESGCLVWSASLDRHGYGKFKLGKRHLIASRVAWIIANGSIQHGAEVCHRCDNRACVDPAHLFLGSHQQNMDDAFIKGRVFSKTHAGTCLNGHPFDTATAYRRQERRGNRIVTKLKCVTCDKLNQKRKRSRARAL